MSTRGSNRESFLARVRQATGIGRGYRVHTSVVPDELGYLGCAEDRCLAMANEVNGVGGRAQIVVGWEQAALTLTQLLRSIEPRTALSWRHEILDRIGLPQILHNLSIQFADYESLMKLDLAAQRNEILAADVGITSATWAIAETGSLVMVAQPGQERIASLLPPVHIAIVAESQIVPDLFDVVNRLSTFEILPSNVTIITGPSKTGDIELQLTTGVHGPGKWHVIIVREIDRSSAAR